MKGICIKSRCQLPASCTLVINGLPRLRCHSLSFVRRLLLLAGKMRLSHGFNAIVAFSAFAVPTSALNYNISLNSQTRLAYAGPNGMMVSWNTYHKIANPTVKYGLSPSHLSFIASSTVSVTYNTSLTYNNHVKITGLLPDTTYYYMPTTLMHADASKAPYSFRTSRMVGDMTPYSIALVVDMGTFGPEGLGTTAAKGVSPSNILKPGETNTIQSITSELSDIDFLLHRKSRVEL